MSFKSFSFTLFALLCNLFATSQDNALFNTAISYDSVADKEGNVYKTAVIGNRVWMIENLRVTKFRNGEPIPTVSSDISKEIDPKYQWIYEDNESKNLRLYGRLYTWYVIQDARGICPDGFRIPTETDWSSLASYLEGDVVAGGKLKETTTKHWGKPNHNATNETGFTALPGGYRESDGKYYVNGYRGYWWTGGNSYIFMAWNTSLMYTNYITEKLERIKKNGMSVRCLKN